MATGRVRIAWERDPGAVADGLDNWWARVEQNLTHELARVGDQMVAYAQRAHPWTNRTGEAEAGLHSTLEAGGDAFTLTFGHRAPHGVYLEYRWAGRWGIVPETLTIAYPLVMRAVLNALKG
jgi:hypothetical protein